MIQVPQVEEAPPEEMQVSQESVKVQPEPEGDYGVTYEEFRHD